MSDNLVFQPSEAAKARTYLNKAQRDEMYARSVNDPNGFWKEQSARIDWIAAPTKIKYTSFEYPDISIKWFEDGVLNISANCAKLLCTIQNRRSRHCLPTEIAAGSLSSAISFPLPPNRSRMSLL